MEKSFEDTIHLVTAFGETKPVNHWAVDPRARVSVTTIHKRLQSGWSPRLAITEEPEHRNTLGRGTVYEAFGKRDTIPGWARLSEVPEGKIRQHMQATDCTVEQTLLFYDWFPDWLDRYARIEAQSLSELKPGDVIVVVSPGSATVTVRRDKILKVDQ